MFERSNETEMLKNRIRLLELRKKRLLDLQYEDAANNLFWISPDLERLETEIKQAKLELEERGSG